MSSKSRVLDKGVQVDDSIIRSSETSVEQSLRTGKVREVRGLLSALVRFHWACCDWFRLGQTFLSHLWSLEGTVVILSIDINASPLSVHLHKHPRKTALIKKLDDDELHVLRFNQLVHNSRMLKNGTSTWMMEEQGDVVEKAKRDQASIK